jgi:hypothetical protein
MACPAIIVTPGSPGTTPAVWGTKVTLSTTDLVGFGPTSGKVSLKCSDGRTLVDALAIVSWLPQAVVVTLPAQSAVAACDSPLFYELSVHIPITNSDCGPLTIDILNSITDPTQLTANDLTQLAGQFQISLSIPGSTMVPVTGVPVRAQIVPPFGTSLTFTDIAGAPLPRILKWNPVIGGLRVEAMHRAAQAQRAKVPPLVLRSPATLAALAKNPTRGRPVAVLPPPAPSVTVEVAWSVTAFSIFFPNPVTVQEGTLFTLADPNDPLHGVAPTLSSVLIGILFQPWLTPLTDPPTPARQAVFYILHARVRLSVPLTQTFGEWIDLPAVQLPVPVLEIPVVLALFSDSNFTGHILPCVPANAALRDLQSMVNKLQAIQTALGALANLASVASWLTGLGSLLGKLPVSPGATALVVANDQGKIDLDSQIMEKGGTFGWDTDWEDQVSSIIFFGPQNTTAAFFSAPDWDPGEGRYDITIGFELNASVRNLSSKTPASLPAGALTVVHNTTDDDFNDRLSTLQFI